MMKRLLYIGIILFVLTACAGTEEPASEACVGQGRVTLMLTVSNRSLTADGSTGNITYPVESEDGKLIGTQHAETVFLYIFLGEGTRAQYVACENIGWKEYFERQGTLPDHTAQMPYTLKYKGFRVGQTYTFLAIGLSGGADVAFGFPDALAEGSTLGSALASLAEGQSSASIRTSEIYVGTEPFIPTGNDTQTTIELWRRVAGVMGFFRNVPSAIDGRPVDALRLSLYTRQNTKMPLVERQQTPVFLDYIDSPSGDADGQVLFSLPLSDANPGVDEKISGGGYVLPAAAPPGIDDYTLRIEAVDAAGNVLHYWRAKLPEDDDLDQGNTGGGTGIIDTESAFRFPIVANHFYAIGSPENYVDLEGSGIDVDITIDPSWAGEEDLEIKEQQ